MTTLRQQLQSYAAYHHDPRNKATHFFGVPLVTFSLFLALSWFRLRFAPDLPITAATLFYLVVFLYYLRLDWSIGLLQFPFSVALLLVADRVALWPPWASLSVFAAAFVGGWIIQLVGHAIEGKRPALIDNLLQVFNAPLFLTAEVLFALGRRRDLIPGD
ncbi:MAG: DUF962 domain-containing protein [Isosphaeraceae bacterium]